MTTDSGREVYLDHHATTPVDKRVVEAMQPYFTKHYGNPASKANHSIGHTASKRIEQVREQVAEGIGARTGGEPVAKSIIFTSGATESNNLAVRGLAEHAQKNDAGSHIITSKIEHEAVIEPCKYLEEKGFDVTYLSVDEYGQVDPMAVRDAIRDETFLVSIMAANNEIGTINPIKEIGSVVDDYEDVWFHTDAVQAIGAVDININEMGIDLMSISGHKIYGPKGIGALYTDLKIKNKIEPLQLGGGHESGKRSGTPNVPGIVGLGKALELAVENRENRVKHVEHLRDQLWNRLSNELDNIILNGHPEERLPNNLNVSFPNVNVKELVRMSLTEHGVMAALGSACASGEDTSHVLEQISDDEDRIKGAVRFGLGKDLTKEDIEYAADVIIKEVELTESIFG
ncbi:cysteine desulfurase family protein [Natronorubrum bangense]|uniref:cysteine desulfurase n=2 Tax=Natronorubrum bangense TaxID=61858 RepID=L9WJP6_9EURY|nr:cysteine desulfurase family protein [Natronorubrum bangense]ELY49720.1 cysteine desulfurase [Natronorubrum bangense JCM 10635]QCC55352.1 cysteine desulfurase [Natronorubrum bangense]